MVSGAISLSLSLVVDVFARRHGVIVCEDPTYFLARGIFASSGVDVVGIPSDDHGLDVDALEQRLQHGLRIDLVYCIPTFHNPTGITLSHERRSKLVALARTHDFVIVADEPYNLLYYDGNRENAPPPMAQWDPPGDRVLCISSFTKILAPGLRLGWIHAGETLLERVLGHGVLRSGGALNPVMAFVVHEMITDGSLGSFLTRLRDELSRRCDALTTAIAQYLPEVELRPPRGGYFAWPRLPPGATATALDAAGKAHRVRFCAGPRCAVARNADDRIRLSFSFYSEEELAEGVRRLAAALAEIRG